MDSRKQAPNRPRRGIVIAGAYGQENAGDDATLTAVVAALRQVERDVPIAVVTRRGKKVARRFGVRAIGRLNLPGWLFAMRRAKLFILGGGSLLQNVTSRRSLWFYLLLLRTAKTMGCAVQLYGCGVGPLAEGRDRERTVSWLNRFADAVTARDQDSLDTLRTWGVTEPRLLLAADPALSLPPLTGERERRAGFVLRSWPGFWIHVPDFAEAARYVWDKYHLPPVFVCLGPGDRQAARSVQAALGDVPSSITVDSRRVGRMSLVLSMRLHGLVFALRDGTPAAGVSYDPKVSSFCREASLPVLELEAATAENLCRLIDQATHLDGETLSAAALDLRRREKVNARVAAELLSREEWPRRGSNP